MNKTVSLPASLLSAGSKAYSDTYTIREAAEMLDMSLRTIRFYEEKGLVRPLREGTERVFTPAEIDALRTAQKYRNIGLTLREIKTMLGELSQISRAEEQNVIIKRYMQQRLKEIESELEHSKKQEQLVLRLLQKIAEATPETSMAVTDEA
ncbi:MAG: MerR family transcriptional regulator [Stappiaceae bacterium]